MSINRPTFTSISILERELKKLIEKKKIQSALDLIKEFVESIINNSLSVAKVFASRELDELCGDIGKVVAKGFVESINCPAIKTGTVILVSEFVATGGHIEIIKDIIRLRLSPSPVTLIVTNLFDRVDYTAFKAFDENFDVKVEVVPNSPSDKRLDWLFKRLYGLSPAMLILLLHNQDSVGIAVAQPSVADKIVYIHHGDHHLSLGVTVKGFVHVDPHNIGFFNCKRQLGLRNNFYWPLTSNASCVRPKQSSFLSSGSLITCTCGRPEKFEVGTYLYDYFDIIPKILAKTGGCHIHIGSLTIRMKEKLESNLVERGLDLSRFLCLPWVPSLAQALIDNNVDLYIGSFPLGGGKASIEAMAAGIPLIMHEGYRSRFHGGVDLVYPEAWVWRNESELMCEIEMIDEEKLIHHSLVSRSHYEKFYGERALINLANFTDEQDISLVPPLREYKNNPLQVLLDDCLEFKTVEQTLAVNFNKELSAYKLQAQEYSLQIEGAITQMENLNQELISRDKELSAYKLQAQEYSLQIEGAITQMENLNQELISRDKELMDLRKQSKVKGSNDE